MRLKIDHKKETSRNYGAEEYNKLSGKKKQ